MASATNRWDLNMMQHNPRLRAAARAIYDACYPSDEWSELSFAEAERYATVQYRQAVDGARAAHACFASTGEQLLLPVA